MWKKIHFVIKLQLFLDLHFVRLFFVLVKTEILSSNLKNSEFLAKMFLS